MRLQLVQPPVYVNPRAFTSLRPAPPLGLAYVAAALEAAGHQVSVIDAVAEAPERRVPEGRVERLGLAPEEVVARIHPETRMVAVGAMWSYSWGVVRELLRQIKAARPDVVLVCGGEHFTGLAEKSMQEAPIDFVVRGEGEETIVELAGAIEAGTLDPATVAGIVWRDGDRLVTNPPRARITDVDAVPWPAWHLFDLETYNAHGLKTGLDYGRMVPVLATRGCPYRCTYCSSPNMWTTKWVARKPELVADEIEHWVRTYGANSFPFQDLTVVIRRDWIIDFCNEILRRKLDIRWQLPSGTRCEVIDDEVARLLAKSGCGSLAYAPESGSDEIRKRVQKRMKRESLMEAVDAAVRHGLNLTCFIVLGFPEDEDRQLRENLSFVRELARRGVDDVACGFFFPIPGTTLYDQLRARGRIEPTDELLLAPLLSHDRYLTSDRNFCAAVPAWRLTLYRLRILLNFYLVSFATRPQRILQIVRNLASGREESKLEAFLAIQRDHFRRRFRRFRQRPAAVDRAA